MSLNTYAAALQRLIAETPFVTAMTFMQEERPPTAGLIKGSLFFVDSSQLDFKEFLIVTPTILVIKYGYHCRRHDRLIFRYDNASDPAARELPTYPHHKHLPTGMIPAVQPSLEEVIGEALTHVTPL